MQEAGPKSQAGGHSLAIAHPMAKCLELVFVLLAHLDVGEEGKVVSGSQLAEVCANHSVQGQSIAGKALQGLSIALIGKELDPVFFQERRFSGKRTGLLVSFRELARNYLAGFHIRLVEGIDSNDRSCDSGRNLPAEKLLAQIIDISHVNAHDWLTGFTQRVDAGILARVHCILQPQVSEDPIIAINLRRPKLFTVDGDQAFALLAGALRKQLLKPGAQIVDAR